MGLGFTLLAGGVGRDTLARIIAMLCTSDACCQHAIAISGGFDVRDALLSVSDTTERVRCTIGT